MEPCNEPKGLDHGEQAEWQHRKVMHRTPKRRARHPSSGNESESD